jgi:tetratricopeptide (TPR) repeat protein
MDKDQQENTGQPEPIIDQDGKVSLPCFKVAVSETREVTMGSGSTKRTEEQCLYWYAEKSEDKALFIQYLNYNFVPTLKKKEISEEEFVKRFRPEPEVFYRKVKPNMLKLAKVLSMGEEYLKEKKYYSAETEFNKALKLDEHNVRAIFGLGMVYTETNDLTKANHIFEKLVSLDYAFDPDHKHLFNKFGIQLRKQKMFSQGEQYYQKALQITADDDHLHYNIARLYYDMDKLEKARHHAARALELDPELEPAEQLVKVIEKKLEKQKK